MAAPYLHVEIISAQTAKRGLVCGDVVASERSPAATTVLCCDGLGSGVRANVAATMAGARLLELLRRGFSLRQAFAHLLASMNQSRGHDHNYAAFTLARILPDGAATVLSYDAPEALLLPRHGQAAPLPLRSEVIEEAMVAEGACLLEPGEGLLLFSDGISQAGLGNGLAKGWQSKGAAHFVNERLAAGTRREDLPQTVLDQARQLWGRSIGDDCTVVLVQCRVGRVVQLFTGPPMDPLRDNYWVQHFLHAPGKHVICGGTTAKVAAKAMKKQLRVIGAADPAMIAPPAYALAGVDLVTEGAVTLNQACNLLGEDLSAIAERNPAIDLAELLAEADWVNFLVGGARNPASGDLSFRQLGVITRERIVDLLAERLRATGKLATIERC